MEASFNPFKEDACKEIEKIIKKIIKDSEYQQEKTGEWINRICDHSLSALKKISGNFKYIASCVICEKSNLDLQNACLFTPFDSNFVVAWENSNLSVILNLFAIAL